MILNLTHLSTEPLHSQISEQLARRIIAGDIPAGTRLPPISMLVREHRVSRSTVTRAYNDLALKGLIRIGQPGQFFVECMTDEEREAAALCRGMGQQSLLNAIESFTRELLSVVDIQALCDLLRENIRKFLRVDHVDIILCDESVSRGVGVPSRESVRRLLADRGDSFVQDLLETDRPMPIQQHGEETTSPLADHLLKRGSRIACPLRVADRFLGFIAVGHSAPGMEYPAEDLDLLGILTNQFVTALTTAHLYVESVEKRRMDDELKIAQRIQANLLPKDRYCDGDLDIAAFSAASRTVVGDFYDYFPIDESRIGLAIADACGKGMPAALLISQIQVVLKKDIDNGDTVQQTVIDLNKHLESSASDGFFATLFYAIVNRKTRTLEFANAGHDFPIVVRQNGEVVLLRSTGPALGVVPDFDHEVETISIREGDCILLYTDGVTETTASNGKQYGALRLKDLLIRNRHLSPKDIIRIIRKDLETFSPGEVPDDDRTLVVLKVNTLDR